MTADPRPLVAVVDDDPDLLRLVCLQLEAAGYNATCFGAADAALEQLVTTSFDVLVTDVMMAGMTGFELCERVVANHPELPVIVMTASNKLETAIGAIRVGAYDFITKPINSDALSIAVARALQHRRLHDEVRTLRRAVAASQGLDDLIGGSDAMRRVYASIDQFASSEATVMITGESGTGKEVVARALHRRGKRAQGPMIAVNCAAIPETLIESELFGHEKGAFTDARTARAGLFSQADGGTLFLDEIGDMPVLLQSRLLRVLSEGEVLPLGADEPTLVRLHVVCATHQALDALVRAGRFREDLYYRLSGAVFRLPALRERDDIADVIMRVLRDECAALGRPWMEIEREAMELLKAHPWPGNIRQLRHVLRYACAISETQRLSLHAFPAAFVEQAPGEAASLPHTAAPSLHTPQAPQTPLPPPPPPTPQAPEPVEPRMLRERMLAALKCHHWHVTLAARDLDMPRSTFYRHMTRLKIVPPNLA